MKIRIAVLTLVALISAGCGSTSVKRITEGPWHYYTLTEEDEERGLYAALALKIGRLYGPQVKIVDLVDDNPAIFGNLNSDSFRRRPRAIKAGQVIRVRKSLNGNCQQKP